MSLFATAENRKAMCKAGVPAFLLQTAASGDATRRPIAAALALGVLVGSDDGSTVEGNAQVISLVRIHNVCAFFECLFVVCVNVHLFGENVCMCTHLCVHVFQICVNMSS